MLCSLFPNPSPLNPVAWAAQETEELVADMLGVNHTLP